MLFRPQKKVLKNSKKSTLCKGVSPWFLSKNRPFSHMFFFSKKSHRETFFDILDRKECFLDHKREVLKNSKKSTFCKGLVHGFSEKLDLFFIFFFNKKSQEEPVFYILESKECFLHLKSEVLKKSEKSAFFKGFSPWFLSKNPPFSHMFFF